jgi:hypothetical protein
MATSGDGHSGTPFYGDVFRVWSCPRSETGLCSQVACNSGGNCELAPKRGPQVKIGRQSPFTPRGVRCPYAPGGHCKELDCRNGKSCQNADEGGPD